MSSSSNIEFSKYGNTQRPAILSAVILWGSGAVLQGAVLVLQTQDPVADAHYQVTATAGSSDPLHFGSLGATPRNVVADKTQSDSYVDVFNPGNSINYSIQQVARAETYGGTNPQAIATTHVGASGNQYPTPFAEASALVYYYFVVQPTNSTGLVWQPSFIPLQFHAIAEARGNANATVSLVNSASSTIIFSDSASGNLTPNPRPAFNRTISFSLAPETYLRITLQAQATSLIDGNPNTQDAVDSRAFADPVFGFDQAAFDLYAASQNEETFQLADYYQFAFSPTIVPEPASTLLLAMGGTLLFGRRNRSQISPRPSIH